MNSIDRYMARLIAVPLFANLVIALMLLVLDRMRILFDFVATEGGPVSVVWQMLANLVPEYAGLAVPLALMKPWSLPLFVLVSLLAPAALLVRFGVLVPLGALIPAVRTFTWERFSALSINPDFRRKPPEGDFAGRVRWQEAGASLWAMVLIASVFVIGWQPLATALAVLSLTAVLNQLRTLVAHLWENEGEAMTVTAQFLDTVNVPPPGIAAEIWAPVGLRYHALHHLMPSMPYHDLPEAHRRLARELGTGSTYDGANHPGLLTLVARIAKSTMGKRA